MQDIALLVYNVENNVVPTNVRKISSLKFRRYSLRFKDFNLYILTLIYIDLVLKTTANI